MTEGVLIPLNPLALALVFLLGVMAVGVMQLVWEYMRRRAYRIDRRPPYEISDLWEGWRK